MEAAAARAGVSKGLGYAYFPNRTELIRALFDREMAELDERVRTELAQAGTLEERVRATIHAWFAVLAERGRLIAVLLQGRLSDGPLEEHRRERQWGNRRWWAHVLEEDLDLPPDVALAGASMVLAWSTAAFDLWSSRHASRRALEDTFVTLAMGGLRALAAEHGRG
jgi:AcrR family transcriptional regulator